MKVLFGIVLGFALVAAGLFFYFRMGYAPVATAAAPMPFERQLAEAALDARIKKEAPATAPIAGDEGNLAAGVKTYREACSMCHGLRGQPETVIAKGMFPKPPQFLARPAKDGQVGQTFWVVKNGIRLTGMPGFGESLSDDEIWQVSLMLEQRDKLPDSLAAPLSQPQEGPLEAAMRTQRK
ncbi:MAG TPA: c-type cytochrome [Bryobacteraceae bacterium]|jgi:mono/diheme cytochrome c family protein|nr:c-type cytochrome [Bryobacteraceae bacterium]